MPSSFDLYGGVWLGGTRTAGIADLLCSADVASGASKSLFFLSAVLKYHYMLCCCLVTFGLEG